jgi:hypothetical protein
MFQTTCNFVTVHLGEEKPMTHLHNDIPVALFSVTRSVDMYIHNRIAFSTPMLSGEYNIQVWAHSGEHAIDMALDVMTDLANKYDMMWGRLINASRFTEWGIIGDDPIWLDQPILEWQDVKASAIISSRNTYPTTNTHKEIQ